MSQQEPSIPVESPTKQKPTLEAEYSAILAAFQVTAKILAIRLFLFLSLIGSFSLAIMAMNNQTTQSSIIMLLYACVTTLPLTILEFKGRKGG